ncbi:MAG: beta-ketoacyl-ACP synthase II [Candidatus Firestonebacteria bacterium]|nr:beta-ketoacyl-ACP synthase II [Candidatus Firestonebacteria bacterium]
MKRKVVITGIGVLTPVGNSKEEMWDSLCNGRSGAGLVTHFDVSKYSSKIAAQVKNFDAIKYGISKKDDTRLEVFIKFAVAASVEAVKDSGLDFSSMDPNITGVVVGSGIGGIYFIEKQIDIVREKGPGKISPFTVPLMIVDMAAGQVAIHHGVRGPNLCVATACATGAHAIGEATRIIQHGDAEVMIAGGTEYATSPIGFGGFCAARALTTRNDEPEKASRPFDRDRDGFLMGDGAGIVVLESLEHAIKRNANIYAEVAGYGMSGDAYHITCPMPDGEGATRAMKAALSDAHINGEQVEYINAHGTSTKINDAAETAAIKRLFGDYAYKIPISSTKSMMGHLLGAAGSVEAAICALTIKNGIIPPTINYENKDPECDLDYVPNIAREKKVSIVLTNSLGFGGHNATLILKKV